MTNFETVNRIGDLMGFLRRWEDRDELNRALVPLAIADEGNINLHGTSEFSESLLLTRWHPSFESCVEAGVRELVMQLVTDWDCVTYSSCEGHRSSPVVPARVRHVRLLPRSRAEHEQLARMLTQLVALSNDGAADADVGVTWKESVVRSGRSLEAPGFDLVFEPRTTDERTYWQALELPYRRCLAHVGQVDRDSTHHAIRTEIR
jgi:hypothetical protein